MSRRPCSQVSRGAPRQVVPLCARDASPISLPSVPREPSELRFPTREIVPPKGLRPFVITRVLAVGALGFIMAVGLNHSSKVIVAATIFLGVVALLAAIQVPLLKRRWLRLEESRLRSLSGDAIYAGPARAENLPGASGSRQIGGELVLNRQGLSFTPRRSTEVPALNIAWADMTHIRLSPISNAPVAGSLEVTLFGGSTQRFVVQRCESLANKLQHLPERL